MTRGDEHEATMRDRAYALLLGAIVQADATHDVDLAWRVADMVSEPASLDRPTPPA